MSILHTLADAAGILGVLGLIALFWATKVKPLRVGSALIAILMLTSIVLGWVL